MTLEEMKLAVDSHGRLATAIDLEMPYGTLSAKLNGYTPFKQKEWNTLVDRFSKKASAEEET